MNKKLAIAVGIIWNKVNRQLFITLRGGDSSLAGFWEFPGGKIEQGETIEEGLYRELWEEIGIKVVQFNKLTELEYSYTGSDVILHFFLVKQWENEPYGKEGQPSRWIELGELADIEFLPANKAIIDLLKEMALSGEALS